ncbi:PDDEXK nuclease domain-containing protein [Chryseobacterium sp. 09-1422]|uniref:PDDEXK nuclease domain-containing protein n=1 Tax=Chryseobacterium kimseyorum TaxID=2984028 RepID=A0ABT3HWW0_9FLAO|nr:PDDEXK nuclease domain-containing protein [Chryseobacterium kimseyorum]MCW3168280.1 PDDEXK nuclease domain-containing protein [Chryseobacterium kimseyorum]
MDKRFTDIINLIKASRANALKTVNAELINLYWNIGEYISVKIQKSEWGQSVVKELAEFIQNKEPEIKGFSDKNLWRMKQFFEAYKDFPKLSTLLRQISWSHNLAIFSRCKTIEEREFYIKLTQQEKYSFRELDRQISSSFFERTMIGNSNSFPIVEKEFDQDITKIFKDTYIFDFLNLPEPHNESDLQKGLLQQMKNFILELGKDFLFVSEEYKVQVGNSDFYIDLLFFHRGLQCLVAFELKSDKFRPEHLGQLNFYLEALDRDVKRQNENPSIGVLLCKDKDSEVVEYALSRSLSPTMVSEYKTQLPDKKLLQQKLHELFDGEKLD